MFVEPDGGLSREDAGWPRAGPPGLLDPPEPGQVVGRPPGGHARETAQEALEALMQGVDHVEVARSLACRRGFVGGRA